jgi:hypothetical protein
MRPFLVSMACMLVGPSVASGAELMATVETD